MSILHRLEMIFREVLDDRSLELTEGSSVSNVPNWDSVATIQILLATESEFGIRFTTDEIAGIKSVSDILQRLKSHGVY